MKDFIGFYRENEEYGFLSNFAHYGFHYQMDDEELLFFTAEHAVHFFKALLFKDVDTSLKILRQWTPMGAKKLGRQVKNFNSEVWDKNKIRIYHDIIKAKFTEPSNEAIKKLLLDTGDAILVECSPYDRIWGIGYDKESPEFFNRETDKWGQNLLGHVLMKVRDELRKENNG